MTADRDRWHCCMCCYCYCHCHRCYCILCWATAIKFAKTSNSFGRRPSGFIPSYDIAFVLAKYGWDSIDFLKMDVEGSEKELFQEPANYMRWLSKVRPN